MLSKNNKFKIALIGDSLSKGGAEKIHAILSVYFEEQGFDVHNCILIDAVTYKYSGSLLNLGKIKANSSSLVRKIFRFLALQKFVSTNDFDCLIDFRMRPSFTLEFILSRLVYPKNSIFTVHSGYLPFYFPNNNSCSKLIYKNRKMVTVSKEIEAVVHQKKITTKLQTIYNPVGTFSIETSKNEFLTDSNYILAVGNMDNEIKQIDRLIIAYSQSNLPSLNIKLIILGEGKFKVAYQELAEKLALSSFIVFKGNVQNPFPYYKNALFFVLSSKNEGFPNVILESLTCETPVVAFDCFSGPSEIINNYQNGILVEDQNFDQLIQAMNRMISDEELYLNCKKNALASVQGFSVETIGRQWLDFIKV